MRNEISLAVKFLSRFVSVGEVYAAGDFRLVVFFCLLGLFVILCLFDVLDSKELDDASRLGFFLGFLNFLLSFENCLGLWLFKNCFLSSCLDVSWECADFLCIELEDFLSLRWCGVKFDFEDGVRDSCVDVHVLQMLVEVKEQVNMVAISEEGSLLPDFG